QVRQSAAAGKVTRVVRQATAEGRGWFETDTPLPEPATLAGRVLLVRHGDDVTRGWTLQRVENTAAGARLHVREEPGFELDPTPHRARYSQFPRLTTAGPHRFSIGRIARRGGGDRPDIPRSVTATRP